jgi:hypothetical protein
MTTPNVRCSARALNPGDVVRIRYSDTLNYPVVGAQYGAKMVNEPGTSEVFKVREIEDLGVIPSKFQGTKGTRKYRVTFVGGWVIDVPASIRWHVARTQR